MTVSVAAVIVAVVVIWVMSVSAVLLGAWLARASARPAEEGFFAPPKGEVFSISSEDLQDALPPGAEEPGAEEKHILDKTKDFLNAFNVIGGVKNGP